VRGAIFRLSHCAFQLRQAPVEITCFDHPVPSRDRPGVLARLERRNLPLRHGAERRREVDPQPSAPRTRQDSPEAEAQQRGIAAVERALDQRPTQPLGRAGEQRLGRQRCLVARAAWPPGRISGLAFLEMAGIADGIGGFCGHFRALAD
jgi:hypothetical protein